MSAKCFWNDINQILGNLLKPLISFLRCYWKFGFRFFI